MKTNYNITFPHHLFLSLYLVKTIIEKTIEKMSSHYHFSFHSLMVTHNDVQLVVQFEHDDEQLGVEDFRELFNEKIEKTYFPYYKKSA